MGELKKILISLPDNLLKEVDLIVAIENCNRSEFVREAMKFYIREKKKVEMREQMKRGYLEMSSINLDFANSCLEADNEREENYEKQL